MGVTAHRACNTPATHAGAPSAVSTGETGRVVLPVSRPALFQCPNPRVGHLCLALQATTEGRTVLSLSWDHPGAVCPDVPMVAPSCSIPTHPIPSHPIPSHPIPSHPVPSHPIPVGRRGAPGLCETLALAASHLGDTVPAQPHGPSGDRRLNRRMNSHRGPPPPGLQGANENRSQQGISETTFNVAKSCACPKGGVNRA